MCTGHTHQVESHSIKPSCHMTWENYPTYLCLGFIVSKVKTMTFSLNKVAGRDGWMICVKLVLGCSKMLKEEELSH